MGGAGGPGEREGAELGRRRDYGRPSIEAWASVRPPRSSGEHGPPMDQTVVLCTLVAFLLYYNTLQADFAYDDRYRTSAALTRPPRRSASAVFFFVALLLLRRRSFIAAAY